MDFVPYSNYFESLATCLKPISHTPAKPRFCRFNIEEVLSNLATDLDLDNFCLLLESFEGRLQDNGGDQVFDNQEGAFIVAKRCPLEDFAAQNEILDDTKTLALQIVARMRRDVRLGESVLKDLDISSIEYHKVGPIFDNVFGHRVTFLSEEPISLAVAKNVWSDL